MNLNIKAALLSAFILPGLGQIVNGKKLKGFVIIIIVNIFILIAFALVLRGMGQLFVTVQTGGSADALSALDGLKRDTAGTRLLLCSFLGLWVYGVVDALLDKPVNDDADG